MERARSQSLDRHPGVPGKGAAGPSNMAGELSTATTRREVGAGLEGQGGQPPSPHPRSSRDAGVGRQQRPEHVLAGRPGGEPLDAVEVLARPGPASLQLDAGAAWSEVRRGVHATHCAPAVHRGWMSLGCHAMELRLDGKTALVTGGLAGHRAGHRPGLRRRPAPR